MVVRYREISLCSFFKFNRLFYIEFSINFKIKINGMIIEGVEMVLRCRRVCGDNGMIMSRKSII